MTIIQKPSPNQDGNRKPITKVVIHWIVGNLASADAVFAKPGGVSAHYGVEDNTIHQYVAEDKVAYHAGVYSVNQESIGIEHSASPDRPASNATYATSGELIAQICKKYSIPLDREHIIKHSQIKATQCPGTMDIDRLITIAKSYTVPMVTLPQAELDQMRTDRDNHYNALQASESLNQELQAYLADIGKKLNECENKAPQTITVEKIVEKVVYKEKIVPTVDLKKLSFAKRLKLLFS